jgi:hypothetical protein
MKPSTTVLSCFVEQGAVCTCSSPDTRLSACWPSPKASVAVRTAVAAAWTMAHPGGRCLHISNCSARMSEACTPTWRHMVFLCSSLCSGLQ